MLAPLLVISFNSICNNNEDEVEKAKAGLTALNNGKSQKYLNAQAEFKNCLFSPEDRLQPSPSRRLLEELNLLNNGKISHFTLQAMKQNNANAGNLPVAR